MSDNINDMNVKQLRNEVQLLRDELAIMKRKFEDIIYNLDTDNFSSRFVKEQGDMRTAIEVTAEGIKTKVSNATLESRIEQTSESIMSQVSATYETIEGAQNQYSIIEQNCDSINAIVSGEYTGDMFEGYFTGIEISPHSIKMIDGSEYSVYNGEGLRFYDSENQIEGWAIEPSSPYGGVLNYYVNGGNAYRFGSGEQGEGYTTSDITLKAVNSQRGRFVVDVTESAYREVKFVGLGYTDSNSPYIYANEQLLATQDWVLDNAGGGSSVAVFG